MLVLTRNRGESILIGEDVVLTVREIQLDEVLFEVCCPPDVAVRAAGFGEPDGEPAPAKGPTGGKTSARHVRVALDEALRIGGNVRVSVERLHFLEGQPIRVRLGIQAPREVPVFRKELRDGSNEPAGEPRGR